MRTDQSVFKKWLHITEYRSELRRIGSVLRPDPVNHDIAAEKARNIRFRTDQRIKSLLGTAILQNRDSDRADGGGIIIRSLKINCRHSHS